jgi:hypothetical protein
MSGTHKMNTFCACTPEPPPPRQAQRTFHARRFARALPLVLLSVALLAGFAHRADAQQCEASAHGMRPGADNLAALTESLKACAGKTLHIAAGTYELNPNGFAPGLTVPSGTTIAGDGPGQTVVRVGSSGNLQAILWIRNASNVTIRGIRFEGASYESGCSKHLDYGHAIYIYSDAGDHPAVENVNISGNVFYNFNGQSWITANAQDGSPGIGINSRIVIENNVFESDGSLRGSCAGTGGIGYPAAMVWLHGSDKSAQGIIANVSIVSNTFNAAYIKSAVAVWSGTRHIVVQGNTIRDAGLHLPAASGELGRYAISIYNSAHDATHELPGLHPDTVSVVGNEIINPVSCGIYVAAAKNIEIAHNRISGQSDRFDGTLPKGAIALNHVESVYALHDNELTGNYIGISSVASEVKLGNNRIVPGPGGSATKIRGGDPNSR